MTLIRKCGKIEIWEVKEDYGSDFYVFGIYDSGDPRVCPSLNMALDVAGIR